MTKWADFVISQANYDPCHLIFKALRHKDFLSGIEKGTLVDRLTIISDIKNGLNYITVYSGLSSWKRGHKIRILKTDGQYYVRIDDNKVKLDNLGDIPELCSTLSHESEEPTYEQFARVEELERQIRALELNNSKENNTYVEIKHEVIEALRKQSQKLDAIENKLHSLDISL